MADTIKELPKIEKDQLPEVEKKLAAKLDKKWKEGHAMHVNRTVGFEFFSRVAHNLNLYEKLRKDAPSEGSTQAIKRKIRAQTIQRVPDGEIITQYDKNSWEQAVIDYVFKHKVLTSEHDGKDMMKNLWRSFNAAYDYGFCCVRTGFEKDLDGDPRITYTIIPYNDIIPSPDCKFIEEADWYIVREYIPRSTLKSLIDYETGEVKDSTYVADVVKYLVQEEIKDGKEYDSEPLADKKRGVSATQSIEVRTYYCRGSKEFITYVPRINCVLRRVKNEDPRKDVPIHFLILEPDPEFPYGASSIMWTLAQQQYADAFQSTAYQTLLLSLHPPLMVFGNLANPKFKMKANAIWPMGTNPNNKVEKFPVETTTVTQYGSVLENLSGRMMQSLNVTDATVASDANVARYSATPQGVEQQRLDKTITINQYQKRIEIFFQEWANHALRSYINSMDGEVELTVDERTRRRIADIEQAAKDRADMQLANEIPANIAEAIANQTEIKSMIIDEEGKENKILVDFSALSADLLSFEVRTGSLIENERETERTNIQEMLIPVSQMIGNISDENKDAFEQVIMQLVTRLCELSDIDIAATTAQTLDAKLVMGALSQTMNAVMNQQGQLDQIQAAMGMQPQGMAPQGALPEQQAVQMPPENVQLPPAAPMPQEQAQVPAEIPPMEAQAIPANTPLPPETGMPADVMPPMEEPGNGESVVI